MSTGIVDFESGPIRDSYKPITESAHTTTSRSAEIHRDFCILLHVDFCSGTQNAITR